MTDMFIPKRERFKIIVEAVVYVSLIILASYFTISGNVFIKMVPMLYFLGIFGHIMFDKPVTTSLLGMISVFTFGFLAQGGINFEIFLLAIYAGIVIALGEVTGHISDLLYQNSKLRKFIKKRDKIKYLILLIISVVIPIFLNNLVNSNFVSYYFARKKVINYVMENYAYNYIAVEEIQYIPSYKGGVYEFDFDIDDVKVKIKYDSKGEIADANMNARKEALELEINNEITEILKNNEISDLSVICSVDFSKVATNPDIINISIDNISKSQIKDVVTGVQAFKSWDKFDRINRIDVLVDSITVTINKNDLNKKEIDENYILNGMKQEAIGYKDGGDNE